MYYTNPGPWDPQCMMAIIPNYLLKMEYRFVPQSYLDIPVIKAIATIKLN